MAKGGSSWLVPLAVGVGVGWLFSVTIGKTIGPLAGRVGLHPFAYGDE